MDRPDRDPFRAFMAKTRYGDPWVIWILESRVEVYIKRGWILLLRESELPLMDGLEDGA